MPAPAPPADPHISFVTQWIAQPAFQTTPPPRSFPTTPADREVTSLEFAITVPNLAAAEPPPPSLSQLLPCAHFTRSTLRVTLRSTSSTHASSLASFHDLTTSHLVILRHHHRQITSPVSNVDSPRARANLSVDTAAGFELRFSNRWYHRSGLHKRAERQPPAMPVASVTMPPPAPVTVAQPSDLPKPRPSSTSTSSSSPSARRDPLDALCYGLMVMPTIETPAEEAQRVDATIHAIHATTLPGRLRASCSWSTGRNKVSQRALQRKGVRGAPSRNKSRGGKRAFLGFAGRMFPSARMTSHQPAGWDMGACGRVEGDAMFVPASTVFAHPAVP